MAQLKVSQGQKKRPPLWAVCGHTRQCGGLYSPSSPVLWEQFTPVLSLSVFVCKMLGFRLGKFSSNPKGDSKLQEKMDRYALLSAAKIFPSLGCGKKNVLEPGRVCLG